MASTSLAPRTSTPGQGLRGESQIASPNEGRLPGQIAGHDGTFCLRKASVESALQAVHLPSSTYSIESRGVSRILQSTTPSYTASSSSSSLYAQTAPSPTIPFAFTKRRSRSMPPRPTHGEVLMLQTLSATAWDGGDVASRVEATPLVHPRSNSSVQPRSEIFFDLRQGQESLVVETIGNPIGFGGNSDVWKGKVKRGGDIPPLVAVKKFRQTRGRSGSHSLCKLVQREVRAWKLLDHQSIARFLGLVYNSDGEPAIISMWYSNGTADTYLRENPDANPMIVISEILSGVQYLHENNVVHGDIKGANVMINDAGHAKLIDLGLSRIIDSVPGSTGLTMSIMCFSIRWCAPELLLSDNAQVTKATDVYACASTVLQLLTGEVPYSSQRERTVLLTVLKKVTPGRSSSPLRYRVIHLEELWDLLDQCWKDVPQRPSISEVKERMRTFESCEPENQAFFRFL